jgi:hypothetical protein
MSQQWTLDKDRAVDDAAFEEARCTGVQLMNLGRAGSSALDSILAHGSWVSTDSGGAAASDSGGAAASGGAPASDPSPMDVADASCSSDSGGGPGFTEPHPPAGSDIPLLADHVVSPAAATLSPSSASMKHAFNTFPVEAATSMPDVSTTDITTPAVTPATMGFDTSDIPAMFRILMEKFDSLSDRFEACFSTFECRLNMFQADIHSIHPKVSALKTQV